MTNWRARARLLAFGCVAGLALSGCAVVGDSDGSGADSDAVETGDEGEERSPLEEYLGEHAGFANGAGMRMVTFSSRPEMSEEERQQLRQVEELVATCMQEAGFEYVAVDPLANVPENDPYAEAFALPPDEFAREYGYGMTTLMDRKGQKDDEVTDPNAEIVEGLSEAAQEAYNRALWGDMAMVEAAVADAPAKPSPRPDGPPPIEEQGCHGRARAEVYGEDGGFVEGPDFSQYDGLFEDMEALRQRIETDPRIVEATEAWAACLAEAGHSGFEAPNDPEDSVMEQMSELYGWDVQSPGDPGDDEATEEAGDGGGAGVSGGGRVIGGAVPEVDEEALAELQEYEIAVATADYECEQEHLIDVRREVAWGFEEEFVEEHRDLLEQYRDAMAEGPVGSAGGVG